MVINGGLLGSEKQEMIMQSVHNMNGSREVASIRSIVFFNSCLRLSIIKPSLHKYV
jgi:hypothetical protein